MILEAGLVIEAVSVECVGGGELESGASRELGRGAERPGSARAALAAQAAARPPRSAEEAPMYCFADEAPAGWRPARLLEADRLLAGDSLEGPAIIAERNSTIVVEPGWRARATDAGHLELARVRPRAAAAAPGTRADPVMLEVFNNLFMNIAEQMGLRLQNTAHSVNIKERLDFSCALFDASGALIANAPHMPVHLGSMSESIRTVIARNPRLEPGEVFVLNDPYHGGTHLPDVTVVTPVFLGDAPRAAASGAAATGTPTPAAAAAAAVPRFFVASRGHHADVGGVTPGSMPPFSRSIAEEGVLLDNFKLVEGGAMRERALLDLLCNAPHPARNPRQNLADLRAQIAANEKGAQELGRMVAEFGADTVERYMRHVQDNAEECVRRVITALKDGEYTLPLDNGARIRVAVRVDAERRSARIDFSRYQRAAARQFQRTAGDHRGGGALCVPHLGER